MEREITLTLREEEVVDILLEETELERDKLISLLEVPSDSELGDLALPCFELSQIMKKAPEEIAEQLAEEIDTDDSLLERAEPKGPYLNFFFDKALLAERVLKKVLEKGEDYGSKEDGKTAVVEFPAPNTNKPLHIGHLRNMALGDSVSRMLEKRGFDAKRVNLYNDRGIHICKSMLAYQKWGKDREPDKKPDHFVGDYYVMFGRKAKDNPELKDEAQEMLRKWEEGDEETRELWKKMNNWAMEGIEKTFEKFGVSFDKVYYESETYEKGKEIVKKELEEGRFYEKEDGAIAADMGDLGEKVLLRSDGTSVYITQDLYLALVKYKDFDFDRSIYVVGNEQDYHFKVLFRLLDQLGFEFADDCYHLSYGMVNLPSGKLKSRQGKVVDADDLIEDLEEMAKEEVEKRHDLGEDEVVNLAEKIGLGALKFFLLKYSPRNDFTFYPEESVSFEGETGPYVQYSAVRAQRILEKAGEEGKGNYSLLNEEEAFGLVKRMDNFPQVLTEAAYNHKPHLIAKYAFDLAQEFNSFYEKYPVLQAEDEETKDARIKLVRSFHTVITSCLGLLGIEVPEKM